jgi:heavy metal sensor kinase
MMKFSIGLRLTLWYLAIFALGQFVFGAGMWLVLRHHLVGLLDESLTDQTEDLRSFLDAQKKNANVPKFQEEVKETYDAEHAGEYLAISTDTGDPIYISNFLSRNSFTLPGFNPAISTSRAVVFEDRVVGETPLRFYRSTISTHGLTFVIAMGASTKDMRDTLCAFRNYLLLLAPLVLLTSAVGGYWLSHRALAPVDALTRTARNISGQNLSSRLEKLETGDELQRLSDTLNEMLERIEKVFLQITQFTADASHELRTPISLMRTEAELALRRARDPEAYREALQHILTETERTSVLIEDLLALARADSGKESLSLHLVDLGELVRNCVKDAQPLADQAGHKLTMRTNAVARVSVMADPAAVRRVLNILFDNAFKFTHAPGRVTVSMEERDYFAIVSVNDNGIGISAAEQSKIFERFYRIDKARGREAEGSGLGLAIARWIVQRHNGSIIVESAPREGSTFLVYIPAVSHLELSTSSTAESVSISTAPSRKAKRVRI